jgi:hypothetical protein
MKLHTSNGKSRGPTKLAFIGAVSALALLALPPTKASAFDIGGVIGTALAIQSQMNAYHGGYSGGYHARTHVASRTSGDSNSRGNQERDARDSDAQNNLARSDNSLATGRGGQTSSDRLVQASERDAATDDGHAPNRVFDDQPAFSPSR